MRSSLRPPNHSSPWPVTQTELAATELRPLSSRAVATSSISPGWVSLTLHASRPPASLVPVQTVPRSLVSVRLS